MRRIGLIVALLALMLPAGCGFHLRGAVELPEVLRNMALAGVAEESPLGIEIAAAIDASGGRLAPTPEGARSVLRIIEEQYQRRVAGLDPTGKAAEYEMRYLLRFMLLDGKGGVMVPEQSVSVTRSYAFDSTNVLAANAEEELLRREMRSFTVRQMLAQLRLALARSGAPAATPAPGEGTERPEGGSRVLP